MKPFHALTNQGRTRRLRHMALAALDRYDLEPTQVSLLTVETNALFDVRTASDRYVLRINAPNARTICEIRSELAWLGALRQDTDLVVPEPVPTRDGEGVVTAEARGVPEARHCVLFRWIPGRLLGDRLSPDTARALGGVLARLHQHANTFQAPAGFSSTRLDTAWTFGKPGAVYDDGPDVLWPPARRHPVRQAAARVQVLLDELYAKSEDLRFLHIDFHPGNIKRLGDDFAVLDFDDSRWAYPLQDIGIALFYLLDEPNYQELKRSFLEGYSHVRPEFSVAPDKLDVCIAARQIDLLSYVLHGNVLSSDDLAAWLERVEQRLKKCLAAQPQAG
jgi:Ser/Thr protein kinase RdoA (MazF antagonist)